MVLLDKHILLLLFQIDLIGHHLVLLHVIDQLFSLVLDF
jgi:hypothetical protein